MRISAKVDYALRAMVELAASAADERPVSADRLASAQGIPPRFLENILAQLRQAGLVVSRRGTDGGHRLARPAGEILLAEIIRAIDGPLANVAGTRPDALEPPGPAGPMREVWVAVRASLRRVLDGTTLADVASGELPRVVLDLTEDPGAWTTR